jgi:hypothetical protein
VYVGLSAQLPSPTETIAIHNTTATTLKNLAIAPPRFCVAAERPASRGGGQNGYQTARSFPPLPCMRWLCRDFAHVQDLTFSQSSHVIRLQCDDGHRVTSAGDEFDLKPLLVSVNMDDGTNVADLQTAIR